MGSGVVDRDKLSFPQGKPTLSGESGATVADDAFVFITQAFCPEGHDLVAYAGPLFHGFPGPTLRLAGPGIAGDDDLLTLSPMHGDSGKEGAEEVVWGDRYRLGCPVCDVELTSIGPCDCGLGELHALDLLPRGGGEIAAVCDVAGCRRSRLVDGLEVLAVFQD
jgi:hypothetical protein